MTTIDRRGLIAGSAALVTGGSVAAFGLTGAADDASDADLELEVDATESTDLETGAVSFDVAVTNRGEDAVTVPVTLEVADVSDEFTTLDVDGGERVAADGAFDPESVGAGEHEWTVTAGDETASGTLTIEADDGDDSDADDGTDETFDLAVHTADDNALYVRDADETMAVEFDAEIRNVDDEAADGEFRLEIDGEEEKTAPVTVEADESAYVLHRTELGEGDHEWVATVGDATERGTVTVVCEDE